MSRFLLRLALGAGLCVLFAAAAPATEQESEQQIAPRPLPSPEQAKILAALDQPTEFDFQERPLGEVMDYFKQQHELRIVLDNRALSDEGLDADTPVTQTLKNIRLWSALRLLLEQLDLTYVVRDGYLLITTKTEAENKLRIKVYPVEDLVTLDSDFRPAPLASDGADNSPSRSDMLPRPTIGEFGGGMGLRGFGLNRLDDEGNYSGLIDLITTTIAPTTWDEVGGPGSITADPRSRSIAVSQTDEVHDQIVVLLAALRRVRDEQMAAAKRVDPPLPPKASEASYQEKPQKLRAFRLIRGTKLGLSKSGWRPPQQIVGDSTPPQGAQAGAKRQQTTKSSGIDGDAAKDAATAKEAEPSKEAEPTAGLDNRPLAPPKDLNLEAMIEKIVKLVPELIEPQSWEPQGIGIIRAVGEGIVVRNTEEVQYRVARLVAELLPDCVPLGFDGGPWGPWKAALEADRTSARLRLAATDNWPSQAEPPLCSQEAQIEEALRAKCDLEFTEHPLIDALRRLAEQRQVQLCIDHRALADEGFSEEAPVTCSIKGLPLRTALQLLLDELDLIYLIRHEVLFVTTKTEAENMLVIKVYPVFDLVARPSNASSNSPGLDFTTLIENITTNIAMTTWDEVGGPGSIQEFTNSARGDLPDPCDPRGDRRVSQGSSRNPQGPNAGR